LRQPRSHDGMMNTAPVPQGTRRIPSRQAETEAPSSANHLRNKVANKGPRRASRPESLSVKSPLRSGAKGSSLGADSGAYAASAPKGATKVLSREARTKALSSANHLCGDASLPKPADAKSAPHKAMSKKVINARSTHVSALSRLSSAKSDWREFLTSKRKSELLQTSPACCEQVGCQLVIVHSVHCRLGPVPTTPPK